MSEETWICGQRENSVVAVNVSKGLAIEPRFLSAKRRQEESRLAAPRCPDENDKFPVRDVNGDPLANRHSAERLADVFDLNGRHGGGANFLLMVPSARF
jgi:hypothetical protein